jgi:murein endopeptidase
VTRIVVVLLFVVVAEAHADRHVVQRGETLEHVAQGHGCTVDAIERANHLTTTLVRPGTVLELPACARPRRATAASTDDAKARQALAVIDGAAWVATTERGGANRERAALGERATSPAADDHAGSASIGEPWHGRLEHAHHLEVGDGYVVRHPARAYGAPHVIDYLRHAIAEVRALYPDVHTLAIGDISAEHGGKISDHRSHQSGLDVDVGFYFTHVPAGYPDGFAAADAHIDLEATWALLAAFARTAARDDGVSIIFLDYDVQRRLYEFARARGTPDDELELMFQYPHGDGALTGLVRHWPEHANHFHVRFKPAR